MSLMPTESYFGSDTEIRKLKDEIGDLKDENEALRRENFRLKEELQEANRVLECMRRL